MSPPRFGLVAAVTLMVAGCHHSEPTTLDFTAQDEGHHLVVQGTTSLPDEAPILVAMYKPPDEPAILQATAITRAHHFGVVILIPPTIAEGPYAVRAYFSPRAKAWSPALTEAVGPHGERLRGPLVRRDADGNNVVDNVQPVWIGPAGV